VNVKGIDNRLWNWFIYYCKDHEMTAGEFLNNMIQKLKGNGK